MRRDELEIEGRYAGPDGRCYQVVDLSPGWRINGSGEWVEDSSTKSRHMPGRGEITYRASLAVKVYLVEGDELTKAVIDPRRLTEPWVDYERKQTSLEAERVYTNQLLVLLRRNLRSYPGLPAKSTYTVSPDGRSVTLPVETLSALMDLAFTEKS